VPASAVLHVPVHQAPGPGSAILRTLPCQSIQRED
jgi:hypothetical protein